MPIFIDLHVKMPFLQKVQLKEIYHFFSLFFDMVFWEQNNYILPNL